MTINDSITTIYDEKLSPWTGEMSKITNYNENRRGEGKT